MPPIYAQVPPGAITLPLESDVNSNVESLRNSLLQWEPSQFKPLPRTTCLGTLFPGPSEGDLHLIIRTCAPALSDYTL